MARRVHPPPGASSTAVVLLLIAASLFVAVTVSLVALVMAREWEKGPADVVTAVTSAGSLAVAMGAVWAAILTLSKQQQENRRHREMATLHLLNEQYDEIFSDIYRLRREAQGERIAKEDMRLIYSRYFTTLATGLRYYQLGMIPRDDFVEWTCNLIARFAKERCIVEFDQTIDGSEIKRKWLGYEQRVYGPRRAFRRYMNDVWDAVESGGWSRLSSMDPRLTEDDANRLIEAGDKIVKRVGLAS